MIKKIVKKIIGVFGLEVRKNPLLIGNTLGEYGIPRSEWEPKDKGYFLKEINMKVPDASSMLVQSYRYAKNVVVHAQGVFRNADNGQIELTVQGITLCINDAEELFILNEIFVEGCYNYIKNKEEYVVLDVGQNVAITTLFFAVRNNVKHVYGYELFPQTFRLGQKNIERNPTIGHKIISNNFGLAAQDDTKRLEYSPNNKGRMGIKGAPQSERDSEVVQQEVSFKDIAIEIDKIRASTSLKIVCKMDCEGAEYELLEHLFAKQKIQSVDVFMIEWHYIKPDHLAEQFDREGYHVLQTVFPTLDSGMLYATKR